MTTDEALLVGGKVSATRLLLRAAVGLSDDYAGAVADAIEIWAGPEGVFVLRPGGELAAKGAWHRYRIYSYTGTEQESSH
jgi:hypothetical protein